MPQLLVDLVRGSHGLSDFLPETFAETRAQALDSFLYGLLSQIDARGNFRQSQRILVSPNVVLEQVEETRASRRSVIITESMKRTIKLFFGPLPIEQCFRRRFRSGLDRVSLFRLELSRETGIWPPPRLRAVARSCSWARKCLKDPKRNERKRPDSGSALRRSCFSKR